MSQCVIQLGREIKGNIFLELLTEIIGFYEKLCFFNVFSSENKLNSIEYYCQTKKNESWKIDF